MRFMSGGTIAASTVLVPETSKFLRPQSKKLESKTSFLQNGDASVAAYEYTQNLRDGINRAVSS